MHSSMRRREAATASRASTRRAAEEASRRPSITVTMEAGMGEASLGAAVAARVLGVLGLVSRPAGDLSAGPRP